MKKKNIWTDEEEESVDMEYMHGDAKEIVYQIIIEWIRQKLEEKLKNHALLIIRNLGIVTGVIEIPKDAVEKLQYQGDILLLNTQQEQDKFINLLKINSPYDVGVLLQYLYNTGK